jgi:hypothetical protein
MLSGLSVAPPETAHKTAARPCLALVPAGFWTPVTVRPPRPVEPPVVCSVSTYWQRGDLSYILRPLREGRTVHCQARPDWGKAAARIIGGQMSGKLTRAGVLHTLRLDVNDGLKTLVFTPEGR